MTGHPPNLVTVLSIAALAAIICIVRVIQVQAADMSVVVWLATITGGIGCAFGLAALIAEHVRPHLPSARQPWLSMTDQLLSLPRFDIEIPRAQLAGLAFVGIRIGGPHRTNESAIAVLHRSNELQPLQSRLVLRPFGGLAYRSSQAFSEAAKLPHFGRLRLCVEDYDGLLEAADRLINERLANRNKGTR